MKTPKARQLPSGSWFCRVRANGKDIPITRSTEKEAVAAAMAIKAGLLDIKKNPQKKTVTQAIDDYIDIRQNILSPSTIRGYRTIQKCRFQQLMHRSISELTQEQWQRAVSIEAKSVSAKTLTNSWRFIASVISEATGKKVSVRLPQLIPNERQWLTPDQIPVFVDALRGSLIEIPALLALSSLRRSELLNLRWSDIDIANGLLRVNGAAVLDENNQLVRKKETKNKTSRRTIPIIPPLKAALLQAPHKGEYVVTLSHSAIYYNINKICRDNGLPEVGIHGLRHSFASLAYHLQMPERIAMEIGGWANDQTMHKIYTHLAQEDLKKHAQSFTDFFNQPE